jgi:hypothetical protein
VEEEGLLGWMGRGERFGWVGRGGGGGDRSRRAVREAAGMEDLGSGERVAGAMRGG